MNARKEARFAIVVDANILAQDFWLVGKSWNHLVKRNFLSHKLIVPRIAIEEAAADIERRAEDLQRRIAKSGATMRLQVQYQFLFNRKRIGKESASALAKHYQRHIMKTIRLQGGAVVDPPDISVATLIERSIQRRKPFNPGDKGFRDTLIWLNTV